MAVRYVANPRYREGAILSLSAAREALDGPVLIMDADVLCPPAMIARLVQTPHPNCFLFDGSVPPGGEEQMLLVRDGRVCDIVRGGAPGWEQGESIGFLKLNQETAQVLLWLMEGAMRAGRDTIEHEELYPDLMRECRIGYVTTDGLSWTEIDFPEDYERASTEILPAIQADVTVRVDSDTTIHVRRIRMHRDAVGGSLRPAAGD